MAAPEARDLFVPEFDEEEERGNVGVLREVEPPIRRAKSAT